MSDRVRVCSAADVSVGQARCFDVAAREIAIVNLGSEGFRAVDAVCSHAHEYLTEGDVDLDLGTIECPRHGSTFDLGTGRPRSLPATAPIAVYRVMVENDDILIEVNEGE
jgi:3-phenylpropionate/trans-cinnamate dioxygenase ferredoxin subunit